MLRKMLLAITLLTATGFAHSQEFVEGAATNGVVPGGASWADSYSAGGKCYISSTNFDHGIGSVIVPTPIGGQTVRQVADRLGAGPGRAGNPLYNDVQCGNGPANNAGDEDFGQCPGRVDQGAAGCAFIGPKWDLASAYSSEAPTTPVTVPTVPVVQPVVFTDDSPACDATGSTVGIAKASFAAKCPGVPDSKRDCDPIFLNGNKAYMCANYRLGSGPASIRPYPDDSTPVDPVVPVDPVDVPDEAPVTPPTPISNKACLAGSRAEVIRQCGNVPMDCDRVNGALQCANYQLGSAAPAGVPTLAQLTGQTDPVDPVDPVDPPVDPTEPRFVLAPSAAAGYVKFFNEYGVHAVDCDPFQGQYKCSDNQLGSGRPGNGGGTTDPVDPVDPVVNGGTITVEAESFTSAFNGTFDKSWNQQSELGESGMKLIPDTRVTHTDPLVSGFSFWNAPDATTPYMTYSVNVAEAGTYDVQVRALSKGTEDNGAHMWVNGSWTLQRIQWCGGKNAWTYSSAIRLATNHCGIQGSAQVQLNAGVNEIRLGAREDGLFVDKFQFTHVSNSDPSTLPPLGGVGDYLHTFNQPYADGDMFAAFFDSSFDPDDEQAAIFVREMLDTRPDVDYIVVNGTKKRSNNGILPNSTPIMQDLFPAGQFYDVYQNNNACGRPNNQTFCEDELNEIATLVQLTLDAGQRFHIAEGGPSAFTADLIRELLDRGVGNLKNIRVVQHSWGWNEEMTSAADLNLIRRHASYIRIANGNLGSTGGGHTATADLNTGPGDAAFRSRALNSTYGSQWAVAFNDINNKVDGSDAVETMWILGIPKSHAPTPAAFADRYFD